MAGTVPEDNPLTGHPTYEFLSCLSRGAHGLVVLAKVRATDQQGGMWVAERDVAQVAIKFIERPAAITSKLVEREVVNHACLEHPHIVRFIECFLTPRHLAITMEHCPGGDLYSYVLARQGLDEATARWFYQQLVLALDYCHKLRISSRDIKLENALLDSLEPGRRPLLKLCDFSYSINEADSGAYTRVGTPGYTAPEVLLSRSRYEAHRADLWSSGVLLYAMLFCRYPFERVEDANSPQRHQALIRRILAVDYVWPADRSVSEDCKDLLSRLLVADPSQRITMAGIQQHPWFQVGMPNGLNMDAFNAQLLAATPAEERAARTEAIRETVRSALAAQLQGAEEEVASP